MVDQLEKPSRLHYGPDFADDLFSSDLIFSDAGKIYDRDPELVFGLRWCVLLELCGGWTKIQGMTTMPASTRPLTPTLVSSKNFSSLFLS
ncbi:hypothetical protein U1Q18_002321 [Sarracenia purpurea var. burkii]